MAARYSSEIFLVCRWASQLVSELLLAMGGKRCKKIVTVPSNRSGCVATGKLWQVVYGYCPAAAVCCGIHYTTYICIYYIHSELIPLVGGWHGEGLLSIAARRRIEKDYGIMAMLCI